MMFARPRILDTQCAEYTTDSISITSNCSTTSRSTSATAGCTEVINLRRPECRVQHKNNRLAHFLDPGRAAGSPVPKTPHPKQDRISSVITNFQCATEEPELPRYSRFHLKASLTQQPNDVLSGYPETKTHFQVYQQMIKRSLRPSTKRVKPENR
jgi:hypothetical protein